MDQRLIKIQAAINELTEKIGIVPPVIGYGEAILNGLYIEAEGKSWVTYRLMCSGERGGEDLVTIALNEDDLLYAILKEVTFHPAITFAAKQAPRNINQRRVHFEKQEELMGSVKSDWKD
ncbi:Imm63 family immunity protein [Polluticoccus soli]|uniref:Imm63 family immunity protein n=1 Tax=Polluticoccus soli TaxID=3034150 RepID=UPI0023E11FE7|nr:Imm63 family immunity protein [Flavipsychrobacter sp. JY13-12]